MSFQNRKVINLKCHFIFLFHFLLQWLELPENSQGKRKAVSDVMETQRGSARGVADWGRAELHFGLYFSDFYKWLLHFTERYIFRQPDERTFFFTLNPHMRRRRRRLSYDHAASATRKRTPPDADRCYCHRAVEFSVTL